MQGGLAFVLTVGDVFEKKLDLLGRNDVADDVGLGQLAEDQADILPSTWAGPPLLPGLMAASTWIRTPLTPSL